MTEQPRNWDKELADIDRVIEKQGAVPPLSFTTSRGGVRPGTPGSSYRPGFRPEDSRRDQPGRDRRPGGGR